MSHYPAPEGPGMTAYVEDPAHAHYSAGAEPHYEALTVHEDSHGHGGHGHDEHGHDDHGHGGHGGHHELPADMKIDPDSGIVPRRCTDFKCCGIFLIFTVITMIGYIIAKSRGNIQRLTHGVDYYGRICGYDLGVENQPWLYWCRNDAPSTGLPSGLMLTRPSCVAYCPFAGDTEEIACLRKQNVVEQNAGAGAFDTVQTQTYTMTESIINTAPYATRPRGGRFCMPLDDTLHDYVLENAPEFNLMGRIMTSLGSLGHLWWVLAIATLFSCIVSYLYFGLLRYCPKVIAYCLLPVALASTVLCIIFAGGIVVLIDSENDFSKWYEEQIPLFGQNSLSSRQGGIYCLIISVTMGLLTALFWGTWAKFDNSSVVEIMTASLETVKNTDGIFIQAFMEAGWKFLTCVFFIDGFRWLASVSWLDRNRIQINGARYASLSQVWEFNPYFCWCMVLWVIGGLWIMEVCTAFGQMCITYVVTKYYFIKKVDGKKPKDKGPFYLWKASRIICLYHPGSLLKGAFYIGLKRPIRFFWWVFYEMSSHMQNPNCCGKFLGCICCFCDGCAKSMEGEINDDTFPIKEGWNSVYINANDWRDATSIAHKQIVMYQTLKYLFTNSLYTNTKQTMCVMCVVSAGATAALVTYLIVTGVCPGTYHLYADSASPLFIANPYLVSVIAFWLGAHVSYGFVTIWDHTMDVLLYCFSWNRKYNRESVKNYVPESVRAIVGWEDTQNDRYPYYGKAAPWMYLQSWFPSLAGQKKEAPAPPPKTEIKTVTPSALGSHGFTQQEAQPLMMTAPHH